MSRMTIAARIRFDEKIDQNAQRFLTHINETSFQTNQWALSNLKIFYWYMSVVAESMGPDYIMAARTEILGFY